ncbi:hypothetical protein NL676_028055 [Syzygium grande]|nr:hypothetical protein NL676_028055 [Syzygium grande]
MGRVGDFGLAKISSAATTEAMDINNHSSSVAVRGSIGYVPPEYGMGDMVSTKGDVYSYGILLLEMFTRRRPTEEAFKDHLNLHTFVKVALPHRATEIVDSAIFNGEDERDTERMRDCIASVLMVGVDCSLEPPQDRMGMAKVLKELHKIRARSTDEGDSTNKGVATVVGTYSSPNELGEAFGVPFKARNPTKAARFLSCKSMSTNSPAVQVKEKIDLTEKEKMIFDRPLATIRHFDPSTELRVVGGWVHDKDGVFGENGLQGEIPETLSKLRGLGFVALAFNQLTGKIPPAIFNISGIFYFSAVDNQLRGSIPPYIGDTLPHLTEINFASNLFTGVIPPSLSNASGLQYIYFHSNSFHGRLPANLGRLKALERMLVGFNQLRDDFSFITSLTNCSRLEIIGVDLNFLEGPLPDSIGNLSNSVRVISMSSNSMFGTIPPGIGNLFNLSFLGLANNSLSGHVPSSIGALHNLHVLELSRNMLTGEIPSSIGNLTLLNVLHLQFNSFYGEIPQSLGNCRQLIQLKLSNNNLSGSIPGEVLSISTISIIFSLAHNQLSGSLPSQVGSLANLVELDLSYNKLTGPIPSSISKCLLLQWLSLAVNSFHGEIPPTLGTLRGLQELDLSHNDFSGKIPRFLVQLTDLNYLNLSLNKLEGEVLKQGVFLNASAVSVFENSNLCGDNEMMGRVGDFGLAKISSAATTEAMDIDNRSSSVAVALPHQATEIMDLAIFNGENERVTERMRDCIASVLTVGVACSLESPRDRMGIAEVHKELHKIRARDFPLVLSTLSNNASSSGRTFQFLFVSGRLSVSPAPPLLRCRSARRRRVASARSPSNSRLLLRKQRPYLCLTSPVAPATSQQPSRAERPPPESKALASAEFSWQWKGKTG